eukprot:maker-scaffold67_size430214-snap-gene-0.13 protein:Tk00765 transcript:maker-scaffold67_size430214-snap-gene-0.13-mRNA-1 annotation:"kunitz-type protease inhibitor 3"
MHSRTILVCCSLATVAGIALGARIQKRSDDDDYDVVVIGAAGEDCPSTPFTEAQCLESNPGSVKCVNSVGEDGCHFCCCQNTQANPNVCSQPQQSGFGRARLLRWFFNGNSCEEFFYNGAIGGGSRSDLIGNENNFKCKELCEASCSP